ncbi:RNA polymerase sigma factor [Clostridium cochlearium]|nr:sigma-70 family RNA polymerase sigma factor [Clostridium cochlearium]
MYRKYRQIMFFLGNRILRDEYLAEDAIHQAFLRIIDNLDKIDKIDCHKTKGFVVIIVENIAIDFYRKRKREKTISFDEVEFYIKDIKNESNLIINDVEEAILKLSINYSSVFRLKYSQGYSNREISEILKISEQNVRQRISMGKK